MLEEDGLASVAQGQHLSPRPSEGTINEHNNGDTQCILEEPGADTLPQLLNEDGGQKCVDNVPELDRDIQLAFQEQEDLSAVYPKVCGIFLPPP